LSGFSQPTVMAVGVSACCFEQQGHSKVLHRVL
jgi:hypothetical protein